jgi:hypothetical protein
MPIASKRDALRKPNSETAEEQPRISVTDSWIGAEGRFGCSAEYPSRRTPPQRSYGLIGSPVSASARCTAAFDE